MLTISCPSCGNPVNFVSQATAYAVCNACQSVLVRQDMNLEKVGVAAAIQEDGSALMIGTSGSYQNVPFDIIGRIQVQYPFGFWNEWFVLYGNGNHGWVGEAQGNYFVSFLTQVKEQIPPFAHLRRGARLVFNDRLFTVTQVQRARVVSCEGELPFVQKGGYEAAMADLRTETPVGATIDYSEQPPMIFIGEYLDFDALKFTNLRELEGWTS